MVEIINCTPHAIVVNNVKDGSTTFEPSGITPRINMEVIELPSVNELFTLKSNTPTGINDLPAEKLDTLYIVSAMVLEAGKKLGRKDLIAPNTNEATRNEKGHIVSVPGFIA